MAIELQLGGAAAAVAGLVVGNASYSGGWGLAALGILLIAASLWPYSKARAEAYVWFAVLERGVLLPSSFTNVPGITTFGGPVVLPRSQIQDVKQLRDEGGRAVMLMRGDGGGGVVAGRVGSVALTADEQDEVLDGFVAALGSIGLSVRDETDAEQPAVTKPAA